MPACPTTEIYLVTQALAESTCAEDAGQAGHDFCNPKERQGGDPAKYHVDGGRLV